jgi:AraC-like DNA-binding protein
MEQRTGAAAASATEAASLCVQVTWATHHDWAAGRRDEHAEVPVYSLRLMLAGAVEIEAENAHWNLTAGDVLLMLPCRSRRIGTRSGAQWLTIGLRAFLFGQVDVLQPLAPAQWQTERGSLLENWLRELVAHRNFCDEASSLVTHGLAVAIVGRCAQASGQPNFLQAAQRRFPAWLRDVLRTADQQPEITPAQLAKLAHFSSAQFRRNFEAAMGVAPRDYLQRRRLEKARQLLQGSTLSVAEIAVQSGVGSPEHFIRSFRRAFGVTPSQWRQLVQTPPA